MQAVPEQAVPDFLNSESVVVGGLPSDPKASGATKRVWSKFAEKYPKLSDVLQKTPGAKARKSFAQEEGGRRVAQGATPLRGATPPTTVPPGSLKEESAVSDRTLTHPPTSVWYSVDEGENFQEEAKSEAAPNSDEEAIREAKKQSLEIVEDIPQSEVDWGLGQFTVCFGKSGCKGSSGLRTSKQPRKRSRTSFLDRSRLVS